MSPALVGGFFTTSTTWKPRNESTTQNLRFFFKDKKKKKRLKLYIRCILLTALIFPITFKGNLPLAYLGKKAFLNAHF